MADGETLYIDLWQADAAGGGWREWLREQERNGMTWEWVPQPIADQVMLKNCTNVPPILPKWLERRDPH